MDSQYRKKPGQVSYIILPLSVALGTRFLSASKRAILFYFWGEIVPVSRSFSLVKYLRLHTTDINWLTSVLRLCLQDLPIVQCSSNDSLCPYGPPLKFLGTRSWLTLLGSDGPISSGLDMYMGGGGVMHCPIDMPLHPTPGIRAVPGEQWMAATLGGLLQALKNITRSLKITTLWGWR